MMATQKNFNKILDQLFWVSLKRALPSLWQGATHCETFRILFCLFGPMYKVEVCYMKPLGKRFPDSTSTTMPSTVFV